MLKITWASLLQSGDGDGAIVTFRVALRLRPADPGYQGNLRTAYLQKADFVAAVAEFQSALQRAPNDPTLHYDLGLAFKLQDKLPEAVAELRKAESLVICGPCGNKA